MAISTSNSQNSSISGAAGAVLQSGIGIGGSPGYYSAVSVNTGGLISGSANPSLSSAYRISTALDVTGDCSISGDLTVDGVSIKEQLAKINERLAILVPDPEMLEKYETLKNLYAQYKMAEALCK